MLLGRDRERREIEQALDRARRGESAVLALVGEPGIGSVTVTLTGTEFFPRLITGPFHEGLVTVFLTAAAMALIAAAASASRGRRYFHQEPAAVEAAQVPQ